MSLTDIGMGERVSGRLGGGDGCAEGAGGD